MLDKIHPSLDRYCLSHFWEGRKTLKSIYQRNGIVVARDGEERKSRG